MRKPAHTLSAALAISFVAGWYYYPCTVQVVALVDDDLCGTFGTLNSDTELRGRPSSFSYSVASYSKGANLLICETSDGWHGVLVSEEDVDCFSGKRIENNQPYSGPCKMGWVPSSMVSLIAG